MRTSTKGMLAAGGTLGLLVTTAAWAAWTAQGSGTAVAQSHTLQFSVDQVEVLGAPLVPGVKRNLRITLTNPKPFPIRITVLDLAGPVAVDAGHPTCVQTGVQLVPSPGNGPQFHAVNWRIPGNSTRTKTAANALTMSNASDSGCQGATFTVPVRATAILDNDD